MAFSAVNNRSPQALPAPEPPLCDLDHQLKEYLREWRRDVSRQQGLAAFVVMHDSTLEALCRMQPTNLTELKRVPGMGERKIASYGSQILRTMQEFRAGARASGNVSGAIKKASKPSEETRRLLAQGRTLQEIAEIRGRQLASVVALVADMVESGELDFQPQWVGGEKAEAIEAACASVGSERLRSIKDALPPEITFDEIRLVLAKLRARQAEA